MINIYAGPSGQLTILRNRALTGDQSTDQPGGLEKWREGGLKAQVVQVSSMQAVDSVISRVNRSKGELILVRDRASFERKPEKSFGVFMSAEIYGPLAGNLNALHTLKELGVSVFTFTHNMQNLLCTGCNERYGEGGFTHLGRTTLKELETMGGVAADLVHMSKASFWQALEAYEGRVLVSHSNTQKIRQHPRNLDDDQIKAIGERDGIIGLNAFRGYVAEEPLKATINDFLNHAMHIAELIGPERVAIGADYSPGMSPGLARALAAVDPEGAHGVGGEAGAELYSRGPEGMEDESKFSKIGVALAERGLKDDEVKVIMGESYLRFLDRVKSTEGG